MAWSKLTYKDWKNFLAERPLRPFFVFDRAPGLERLQLKYFIDF